MRKLVGLQYLRGFAAISVVIFHAAGRSKWTFHAGEAGVDLFFLLSGFLMVVITGPGTRPLSFLADRARRIVPVYWVATSVVLAGALAGAFPNIRLTVGHVAASFLFVPWQSPSNGRPWPLLAPGWTLNYEMIFYLLFAALLPLRRQIRQVAALTSVLVALVAVGAVNPSSNVIAAAYTDPIILEFAGGCWLGILWKRGKDWPGWLGPGTALLAVFLILAIAMLAPQIHRAFGFGIPAALLLSSILAMEQREAIRDSRLLRILGDASYSIYLWHTLAISVALSICGHFGISAALTIVVGSVTGILAGIAGYFALERPILVHFRERQYIGRVPIPAGP